MKTRLLAPRRTPVERTILRKSVTLRKFLRAVLVTPKCGEYCDEVAYRAARDLAHFAREAT